MVVDIKTRVIASRPPPSFKYNAAINQKIRSCSPPDDSEEKVTDINATVVISVIFLINSVVNEILLEEEVSESLISTIYIKRLMIIIICA